MKTYNYRTNIFLGIILFTIIFIVSSFIAGYNPINYSILIVLVIILVLGVILHYLIRWFLDIKISEETIELKRKKIVSKDIYEVNFEKIYVVDSPLNALSESTKKYVTLVIFKYHSFNNNKEIRFIPEYYCSMKDLSNNIMLFLDKNNIQYTGEIKFYKQGLRD